MEEGEEEEDRKTVDLLSFLDHLYILKTELFDTANSEVFI